MTGPMERSFVMKVSSLDELERVFQLINQHRIDVLELDGVKVVRGASVSFPVNTSSEASDRQDDVDELLAWQEGNA